MGLAIDGTVPKRLRVEEFTAVAHATRRYGIVADYDWCEAVWFTDAYESVACGIAEAIGDYLEIPVTLPEAAAA